MGREYALGRRSYCLFVFFVFFWGGGETYHISCELGRQILVRNIQRGGLGLASECQLKLLCCAS